MRPCLICPTTALFALFVANAARAQDVENGRRISERSCASCHLITPSVGKAGRAISFPAVAAKPGMSEDIVSSFLRKPTVYMPGLPLGESDARDVAAFIMSQKK